ncbi:MAG: GMC oxidoreductase, partial [Bdellovibrionota bacterium]
AGVGGGSLVFGGMMLQPTKDLFTRLFPADVSYDELDQIYYPRVRQMIGVDPIPDDVLSSPNYVSTRLFLQHAATAGFNNGKIHDAVNWQTVRDEIAGKVVASASVGESVFGMNSGAKNSVDRNYLALAEASGLVTIKTQHVVTDIRKVASGYEVSCDQIDEGGNVLANVVLTGTHLFLAAGSMGTSKLLTKAKATGALPELNDEIGKGWGNNGDRLFVRLGLTENTLAYQGGPASAAIYDPLNSLGPVNLIHGPGPIGFEFHAMAILGMGIPDGRGTFNYDAASDSVTLQWNAAADANSLAAIQASLAKLNSATEGSVLDISTTSSGNPYTYHPLGGAVLGKATDSYGRLHGYSNLYVVDSALIPGSAGCCNPAWTVAAIAERCMDRILAEDFA